MPSTTFPVPPQFGQSLPFSSFPVPRQILHMSSPVPGVPGGASSPGLVCASMEELGNCMISSPHAFSKIGLTIGSARLFICALMSVPVRHSRNRQEMSCSPAFQ
jgi:hypothetical protein